MSIVLSGLMLGFSLIIAVGPQNVLIIRQGARREGITAVIIVCLLSDIILLSLGTLGVGILTDRAPFVLTALKWAGVAYLGWFAFAALRDGLATRHREGSTIIDEAAPQAPKEIALKAGTDTNGGIATLIRPQRTWAKPMWAAIALTWLNPSAYLDTLVIIGGMASQYGDSGRWLFTGGALIASAIWFPLLGYGAGFLSGPLSSPKVWRVLNIIIAIMLGVLAIRLALM